MAIPQQGQGHIAAEATNDGSNGCFVGGQMYFPNGVSIFSGSGAPGDLVNGGAALVGDLYLRLDGGLGTTIYRCTTAAPGSVWGAIL